MAEAFPQVRHVKCFSGRGVRTEDAPGHVTVVLSGYGTAGTGMEELCREVLRFLSKRVSCCLGGGRAAARLCGDDSDRQHAGDGRDRTPRPRGRHPERDRPADRRAHPHGVDGPPHRRADPRGRGVGGRAPRPRTSAPSARFWWKALTTRRARPAWRRWTARPASLTAWQKAARTSCACCNPAGARPAF